MKHKTNQISSDGGNDTLEGLQTLDASLDVFRGRQLLVEHSILGVDNLRVLASEATIVGSIYGARGNRKSREDGKKAYNQSTKYVRTCYRDQREVE